MSEEIKNQSEEELWDVISNPAAAPKAEKTARTEKPARAPKSEPRFAKPKSPRKIDGFFVACMAGVAAVSVAATLLLGSMLGGNSQPAPGNTGTPGIQAPAPGETVSQQLQDLERENAQLRAQLEQQKQQIKDLQADLLKLMGSEEYLATAPSDPVDGGNEVIDAQVEAYSIFAQIQEAYADFDLKKLEELIPEMDARLSYLSSDALNVYYKILEYIEQPSNR